MVRLFGIMVARHRLLAVDILNRSLHVFVLSTRWFSTQSDRNSADRLAHASAKKGGPPTSKSKRKAISGIQSRRRRSGPAQPGARGASI